MEECKPGYVKLVTLNFLVQNRFIFAMFCSVFIYLFIEHTISVSPPYLENQLFLAKELLVKIDCKRVLIKHRLVMFLDRSWLNKMCCPSHLGVR